MYQGNKKKNYPTVLIKHSLRSGQKIYYPGNVAIEGDINPGAEIIAKGDILVMGNLFGLAHAGAEGDLESIILAFNLKPTQLRIANYVARPPEEEEKASKKEIFPEIAYLQDEKVIIERYKTLKKSYIAFLD